MNNNDKVSCAVFLSKRKQDFYTLDFQKGRILEDFNKKKKKKNVFKDSVYINSPNSKSNNLYIETIQKVKKEDFQDFPYKDEEEIHDCSNKVDNLNIVEVVEDLTVSQEKLLNDQISILKEQLINSGIVPLDEIVHFKVAKQNLQKAFLNFTKNSTYENELEFIKWDKFVTNHPDYKKELKKDKEKWIETEKKANMKALILQKKIVPKLSVYSLKSLTNYGSTFALSNRILKNKSLLLIHKSKKDIEKIHLADLQFKYAFNNLDLTELRALFICLPDFEKNALKQQWKNELFTKLQNFVLKQKKGTLESKNERNPCYNVVVNTPENQTIQDFNETKTVEKLENDNAHENKNQISINKCMKQKPGMKDLMQELNSFLKRKENC
tara:strand:- start:2006 stop:3151 length:1146 start_codon:yes stop_codon:yes gene_type:complete